MDMYEKFLHLGTPLADMQWCMVQDNEQFEVSPRVDEFLALLEAGERLPPDPREVGRPKEDAAAFVSRMEDLVARYEAQFLKRDEWKVPLFPLHDLCRCSL